MGAFVWGVRRGPPATPHSFRHSPPPRHARVHRDAEQSPARAGCRGGGMAANENIAFVPGTKCWIAAEGEEVWAAVEVVKTEGDSVVVKTGKSTKTLPAKDVYVAEPRTAGGVEDMVKLSYLHEPGVLHNLGFRYGMNEIYTYTGNILIAVNPFQRLPHLYNEVVMNQYRVRRRPGHRTAALAFQF